MTLGMFKEKLPPKSLVRLPGHVIGHGVAHCSLDFG